MVRIRRIEVIPMFSSRAAAQKEAVLQESGSKAKVPHYMDLDVAEKFVYGANSEFMKKLRQELSEYNKELDAESQKSFEAYCVELLREYYYQQMRLERNSKRRHSPREDLVEAYRTKRILFLTGLDNESDI